jgi:ubiquitin-protein ligase
MENKPTYDFSSDLFKKNPFYKRLAKDHISLFEIDSDVIEWEVVNTRGALKIPCEYHFHYHFKSITGTNEDLSPIYGFHHIAKVTFPPKYPIEAPELYMQSDIWHPNVKSEGKYKGRICGNTKGFGLGYDLYLLVIRIAEILQFKQYHSENTPPFPEDIKAARWVMEYAEPNGVVNKYQDLAVDNTPLVRQEITKEMKSEPKPVIETPQEEIKPVAPEPVEETPVVETPAPIVQEPDPPTEQPATKPTIKKISIKSKKAAGPKKIVIQKKNE